MKGYFKLMKLKNGIKKAVKVVGKVADNALLGGAISSIQEEDGAPKGRINYERLIITLISSTIPIILLILLAKGIITIDELKELVNVFK
jgi:hypothetical protein